MLKFRKDILLKRKKLSNIVSKKKWKCWKMQAILLLQNLTRKINVKRVTCKYGYIGENG